MQILQYKAEKLHGFLDFNIKFRPDLNFLTGINGSGKTSIVNSIVCLISPTLRFFFDIEYKEISLTVYHDNRTIQLFTKRSDDTISFGTSESEDIITENLPEFRETTTRDLEEAHEYIARLSAKHADRDFMKIVRELPTPMFLGLERRAQLESPPTRMWRRSPPIRRNIFGATLLQSLHDAEGLAGNKFGEIQSSKEVLTENIRKNLILRAFRYSGEFPYETEAELPDKTDQTRIMQRRPGLYTTLMNFGITNEEIQDNIQPIFNSLENVFKKLPSPGTDMDHATDEQKDAMFTWVFNKHQFDRMVEALELADRYIRERNQIDLPITNYLESVNSFLRESNKSILFNRIGRLRVLINNRWEKCIDTLSSGERQILVILTHIAFHPDAQRANVLMIDEPELSLHVSWQELFTDAIRSANRNIQMILATHSPAIILDQVNNCIDLSGAVR